MTSLSCPPSTTLPLSPPPPQVAEVFTGTPGKYVDLKDTIAAFQVEFRVAIPPSWGWGLRGDCF